MNEPVDFSPGLVNKLVNALQGVMETIHRASALHAQTAQTLAAASDRHARSLTRATWVLAGATLVLVIVTAVHAYIAATHP